MPKSQAKKIIYLLVIGIFIWFFESFVHVIIFPQSSFWEALISMSNQELYIRLAFLIVCSLLVFELFKNKNIQDNESQIENIFNNVIPICITNLDYEIVKANDSYWSIWGEAGKEPIKCYDSRPGKSCHTEKCALTQVLNGAKEYVCESQRKYNGENYYFIVTARPFLDRNNKMTGIIESFQDITERKKLEDEKAKLIDQLQSSLDKVKLLKGLLPICASCRKIRDDKGYWNQIENYIRDHSEAEFSHSICPECTKKLYPELTKNNENDTTK